MSDPLDFRFDTRVAGGYDEVRAHPAEVSAEIARAIVREVGEGARVFEPGVGTGRIALPLVRAGLHVVGADLSEDMLDVLGKQSDIGPGTLELIACNVEQPPLEGAQFDAVICVHVLHLLDDWAGALARFVKLLKPGGCVILGRDWIDPESVAGQLRMMFRRTAVELSESISMPPMAHQFVGALVDAGAVPQNDGEEVTAAEWPTRLSLRQLLEQIRSKDDPESWVLPDDLLLRVMQRLDAWAEESFDGELDALREVTRRFVYSVLRTPA